MLAHEAMEVAQAAMVEAHYYFMFGEQSPPMSLKFHPQQDPGNSTLCAVRSLRCLRCFQQRLMHAKRVRTLQPRPTRLGPQQVPSFAGVDLFGTTITDGQAYLRDVAWPLGLSRMADAWQTCHGIMELAVERSPLAAAAVRIGSATVFQQCTHDTRVDIVDGPRPHEQA